MCCDEERKPQAALLAAERSEAADRICGLVEMMCSISHPNEFCYIKENIVINQKKYPLREVRAVFIYMFVEIDFCFLTLEGLFGITKLPLKCIVW